MEDLSKSDNMICNSFSYNMFNWKKINDLMFLKQMSMPPQDQFTKDICIEDKIKFGVDKNCDDSTTFNTRGGNNDETCEPCGFCKGFVCYNQYNLSEFLLTPCPINTWKNSIIQNDSMGCSKRHQFFMNVTKR